MRTEDLLRKLAPLLPARVRSWRAALALADAPTRRLLEQHIRLVARARLGDPGALLLSLPPRKQAPIALGTVRYEAPKWPVGLRLEEVLQHVAIFGRSGAGKTNVLFHLLRQLTDHHVPFVLLDWKRTGRHLIPLLGRHVAVYTPGRSLAPLPFNPFLPPPGMEPGAYAHHVIDALARAYTLGAGAMSLLHKALGACHAEGGPVTPARLLARVQALPALSRARGWKTSAVRALESILATTMVADGATQAAMLQALVGQHTIIELDALSPSTKAFLLPLVCLWLYHVRLASTRREQLSMVLIIEEAHHVLYAHRHAHETTMELLLRQCRELGIGIIVVDQHPHLLSSAALGNTYTTICLNLKDPKDCATAARLCLLRPEEAPLLGTLPVGRGVVKLQDRWRKPFLVDFPLVPVEKGTVTDAALAAYVAGKTTLSAPRRAHGAVEAGLGRPRLADEERFLHDVASYPDDGVDTRYRRLGMSADRGTRLKRQLVTLGLLAEEMVHTGRTRRVLLRLTTRAQGPPAQRRASIAHEYWKRYYANHLRQQGYRVQLEAPRPSGGRVDVLGTRASESVAIEVETGKSSIVENVRNDLRAGYDRIIVVATSEHAWVKVWRALQRAGLIIPQVSVVLREGKGK